jgi:hypothetical protein
MRMKKIYIFNLVVLVFFLFSSKLFSQDMITGGNMENADDWATCALNMDADNTVDYEFNFTGDKPSDGVGGCLYVTGTNTGTTGGNLTNFMFYQQVTLHLGVEYTFNLAYKDARTNNYWFEAYIGGLEPEVGSDYAAGTTTLFIGGYKSTNWEANCPADEFDAMFLESACSPNATNPFTIEGTGDTIMYVGFRMGIYDGDGNGYSFETYVDNVSLTGPESAIPNYADPNQVGVFPNPASGSVTVTNIGSEDIRIFNLAGQEVFQMKVTHPVMSVDISGLEKGMYLLKSGDSTAKLMIE